MDRRRQGAVPLGPVEARGHREKALLQLGKHLTGREHGDPGSRQLNREGEPLQSRDERPERVLLAPHGEVGNGALGAVEKERDPFLWCQCADRYQLFIRSS